jgi:hypothetical protein
MLGGIQAIRAELVSGLDIGKHATPILPANISPPISDVKRLRTASRAAAYGEPQGVLPVWRLMLSSIFYEIGSLTSFFEFPKQFLPSRKGRAYTGRM